MSNWTLQVGNWATGPEIEVTDATSFSLRARLQDPSELSITIPGDSPQASRFIEFVTDAWLLQDGVALFRGRLVQSQDSVGVDYQCTFTFKDYRYVLDRRVIYPDAGGSGNQIRGFFTTYPQEGIVKQLIDYAQGKIGGNLGITYTAGSIPNTGILLSVNGFAQGDKIATSINSLARLVQGTDPGVPLGAGFDWDIDPSMVFWLYYPWRGTDNGVTLDYGGVAYSAERSVSDTDFANAVYQSGGDAQAPIELTAADLAWRAEGRWDASFPLEPVLSTVSGVQAKATYNLGTSAQFQPGYTFVLRTNVWDKNMLWLGDTVTYVIDRGRLSNVSSTTRVQEVSIDFDSSNNASVSVTVGKPKITLIDNLLTMGNLIWYLRKK